MYWRWRDWFRQWEECVVCGKVKGEVLGGSEIFIGESWWEMSGCWGNAGCCKESLVLSDFKWGLFQIKRSALVYSDEQSLAICYDFKSNRYVKCPCGKRFIGKAKLIDRVVCLATLKNLRSICRQRILLHLSSPRHRLNKRRHLSRPGRLLGTTLRWSYFQLESKQTSNHNKIN